ncbi:P-loop NTPase [Thermodesulfobacteriota bacterium]
MKTRTSIIPIASGKGGVGKTFFAANLAMAMAKMGYETVAIDMDLGGSNLHSFLGLPNRFPGIGDFLKAGNKELETFLVSTDIPHLKFLSGDGRTPFLANISYARKVRLISDLKKLPADYIFLDLGAGTSFNTLDFFRVSSQGFVVITPDYPSIMSMMAFLKNFLLRAIERTFAKSHEIGSLVHEYNTQSMTDKRRNIDELQSSIASIDSEAGQRVTELCRQYRPRVIFNMGEHPDEIRVSENISKNLKNTLSCEIDYFGFVFEDHHVRQSVKKRIAFLPNFQNSIAAQSIERVAERIVKFWDKPVKNSSMHLLNRIRKVYESSG